MLTGLLTSLVSGLVAPILLELWKEWRKGKRTPRVKREVAVVAAGVPARDTPPDSIAHEPTLEPVVPAPKPAPVTSRKRLFGRLLLSPVLGFFGGGLVAGFLESRGYPHIELGSDLSLVLIVLCSIISWSTLSTSGRFKSSA